MTTVFNKARLQKGREKLTGSMPGESNLFEKGHLLELEHVPTGYKVKFPAYLENFSDAYTQSWNAEDVYGRMDPIAVYQNTKRAIAMSWHVPANSPVQAKENLDVINVLMSFMYPLYSQVRSGDPNQGNVINMGPLMKIKFGNLVQNAETGEGLMGYINGFTVDILTDNGIFMATGPFNDKVLYPKSVTLNFELNVLHEHPMGWMKRGDKYQLRGSRRGFPYSTDNMIPSYHNNQGALDAAKAPPAKNDGAVQGNQTSTALAGGGTGGVTKPDGQI